MIKYERDMGDEVGVASGNAKRRELAVMEVFSGRRRQQRIGDM